MLRFQGSTVLVTGSGTGIGRAIARRFAKEGASLIILGRRPGPLEDAAEMLRGEMKLVQSGASVRIFPGVDVGDESAVTGMFETLAEDGTSIDILVNNAGVSGPVTCFANDDLKEFESTIKIHLTGTFWTSRQALQVMKKGARIITISTFFTEERPLEQRPYRFRDPYTASQGAKNRLAEAMSWELNEKGIVSIATNPGPVHSDRIYKTVYPKAAAEFMRVSGFEDLSPIEVERAARDILQLLGEDEETVRNGITAAAGKIASGRGSDAGAIEETLGRLLSKIQTVAEKIQVNTSRMIADGQFLEQDQVAETILTLADGKIAGILNGKVVPGDRVFYAVRGHVGNATPRVKPDYTGKVILFTVSSQEGSSMARTIQQASLLAGHIKENGGRVACILSKEMPEITIGAADAKFTCDLGNPGEVDGCIDAASKMGEILAVVHMTGNVPIEKSLMELSRAEWDGLVHRFIQSTATIVQRSLEHFVPGGSRDPRLFRDRTGRIILIGPDLPVGRKVSGAQRARVEVFRGALRPFVTTVNQELSDVLRSRVRLFAVFPGSVDGREPDEKEVTRALDYLSSQDSSSSAEVIFCIDEKR